MRPSATSCRNPFAKEQDQFFQLSSREWTQHAALFALWLETAPFRKFSREQPSLPAANDLIDPRAAFRSREFSPVVASLG